MTSQLAPARILIVDDHPIVQEGLVMRLSMHRNWEVCGEAGTQDEAISTVLRGERFLSPAMTQRLVARAVSGCKTTKDPVEYLSDREIEIFRLIGEGLTSGAIADKLFISTHTLDTHRENLKRKLGAANAAALNRRAVQWLLENG